MKTIRHIIIGIFIGALLSGGVAFAAVELNVVPNPFPIFTNNEPANIEAYNINGYTYGKWADVVREVNKALGREALSLKFDEVKSEIHLNVTQDIISAEGANTMSETTTQIQYDTTTGLPVGAIYISKEKGDIKYQAMGYNDNIYITIKDLMDKFNYKSRNPLATTKELVFEKDGIEYRIQYNDIVNVVSCPNDVYINIKFFAELQ
jgi:hypothetical protein